MEVNRLELRIYYECLEQALHFLAPISQRATGISTFPTLIEISKTTESSVVAASLASGLALRNPDGIVTVVVNGVEHPLAWIEFTTQATTEDHSLQGFNSLVAAGAARIPFIKIVARRSSTSSHGGNTSFDFLEPYKLLWREFSTPGIQLDWPVTSDGSRAVRDPKFRACPPSDLGLEEVIRACYAGVLGGTNASDALVDYVLTSTSEIAQSFKSNMGAVSAFVAKPKSTRFYQRSDGRWELKFNRWSHSMDPERGMAEYYGTLLGVQLVGRLNNPLANSIQAALDDMRRGTGINVPSSAVINGEVNNADEFILQSNLNRAGLIIAWYCDEFILGDKDGKVLVKLRWNVSKPHGLNIPFEIGPMTEIQSKLTITEDDVTYVIANQVLPANGFDVLSVSYPGAQGDLAILTGSGRSVQRKYFDIIAVKAEQGEQKIVSLIEAKGKRQSSVIYPDVETVLAWQVEPDRRANLLDRIEVDRDSIISSSVAYPGSIPVTTKRQDELDMVILVENDEWKVFGMKEETVPGIAIQVGSTSLPPRYVY
jgi:hypothetical protein